MVLFIKHSSFFSKGPTNKLKSVLLNMINTCDPITIKQSYTVIMKLLRDANFKTDESVCTKTLLMSFAGAVQGEVSHQQTLWEVTAFSQEIVQHMTSSTTTNCFVTLFVPIKQTTNK